MYWRIFFAAFFMGVFAFGIAGFFGSLVGAHAQSASASANGTTGAPANEPQNSSANASANAPTNAQDAAEASLLKNLQLMRAQQSTGQSSAQQSPEQAAESNRIRAEEARKKNISIDAVQYEIDWERLMVTARIHGSWPADTDDVNSAGTAAYNLIDTRLPSFLALILNDISATAQESLLQFMQRSEVQRAAFTQVQADTIRVSHIPDANLFGMTVVYETSLAEMAALYMYSRLSGANPAVMPALRGVASDSTASPHEVIIFSAENALPLKETGQGTAQAEQNASGKTADAKKFFAPKFLPRVYAQNGTLVYSPEYFEQRSVIPSDADIPSDAEPPTQNYQTPQVPFRYAYAQTMESAQLPSNPFVVSPLALHSADNPDLIISNADARSILGSEKLRALMKAGKVLFVIRRQDSKTLSPAKNASTASNAKSVNSSGLDGAQ